MDRRTLLIGAGTTGVLALGGAAAWHRVVGSQRDYARYAQGLRAPLPADPEVADLLRYARLAPSGHNTQPWHIRLTERTIDILPDPLRATPVVDPDDHHLFVSLGCMAETLAIAGRATGRAGTPEVAEDGTIRFALTTAAPQPDPLFEAIPRRQSTRAAYDGRAVPAGDINRLLGAAQIDGVDIVILSERLAINRLRDLVVAGNDTQMRDPAFLSELKHWLRFSPHTAIRTGDGLYAAASGNPVLPDAVGPAAFDLFVTREGENDRYARHIDSSPGIAVFFGDRADKASWIAVGRACQRFALAATSLGLKLAFVNQPVEVAGLRGELSALAGVSGRRPDLVIRFGYGPALPYSPRRPVAAFMV